MAKRSTRTAGAKLRVLGCGEAFDSGLGNNACLLYGTRVPTLLFDCGYQIPERLWALPELYTKLEGIYLTHTHADHAFGLVPLLVRFSEEGRTEPLWIAGPRGVAAYVRKLLELGYPGAWKRLPFELKFKELRSGDRFNYKNLKFHCVRSNHSVLNLAVRVEGQGEAQGVSFGISGDGQLNDQTRALFHDVRVLLHETYSAHQELDTHCDLKTLSKFVKNSAMERVGITHVNRNEKQVAKRAFSRLHKQDSRWFWLKPAMELQLL